MKREATVKIVFEGMYSSDDLTYNRKGDYNHLKDNLLRIHGVKHIQIKEFD